MTCVWVGVRRTGSGKDEIQGLDCAIDGVAEATPLQTGTFSAPSQVKRLGEGDEERGNSYCGVGLPAILSPSFSVPWAVSLAAVLVPWPISLPTVLVPSAVLSAAVRVPLAVLW
jgi:hypothetical protein